MLQPVLGITYWYFIWNLPKLKGSVRDPAASRICALPVQGCNLVLRLDRISRQLRVQFKIKKGDYDSLVGALPRTMSLIDRERERLLGKWIKDEIDDKETWLLVVAVEINTENVLPANKRSSSKKQEVFEAKVKLKSHLYVSHYHVFNKINVIIVSFNVGGCVCSFTSFTTLCTAARSGSHSESAAQRIRSTSCPRYISRY